VLAALALAGLAGMGQAVPDWAEDAGFDFWNLPQINRQLEEQARRSEDLDARLESSLNRIELRQRIIGELLAGQITLSQAAAQFRDLTWAVPKYVALIQMQYPNMNEAEKYCRYVLDYARRYSGHHKEPGQIISRLEREFNQSCRQSGSVHLP
jgi:hypothetical protein